mmetsp:Transcript_11169/g.31867  ORF Transcript_11169/g.31867 Transcript_11169/m.31867 type:complete len:373 (+) Transcript_11169:527-1645(+)
MTTGTSKVCSIASGSATSSTSGLHDCWQTMIALGLSSTTPCNRRKKPSSRTTRSEACVCGLICGGAQRFSPVVSFSKYVLPVNSSRHCFQSRTSSGTFSGAVAIRMLIILVMCFFNAEPCSLDITPKGICCKAIPSGAPIPSVLMSKTSTSGGSTTTQANAWPCWHFKAMSKMRGVRSWGVVFSAMACVLSKTQTLSTQSVVGSQVPSTAYMMGAEMPWRAGSCAPEVDIFTRKSKSEESSLNHSPSHNDRSISTMDSWMSDGLIWAGSTRGASGSCRGGNGNCTSPADAKALSCSDVLGGVTDCLRSDWRSTLPVGNPSNEKGLKSMSALLPVIVSRYSDVRHIECTSPAATSLQIWYLSVSTSLGSYMDL